TENTMVIYASPVDILPRHSSAEIIAIMLYFLKVGTSDWYRKLNVNLAEKTRMKLGSHRA
ncbi:hypothetical protein, partial [Citrobacter koseri]|uniref:hypothetical protein n=1 Tax=Citrobacter koseri TaxID=545 RepID=UPI001A932349